MSETLQDRSVRLTEMAGRQLPDSPYKGNPNQAFAKAIDLVTEEVRVQLKMWGQNNERADASQREMMMAAMATLDLVFIKASGLSSHTAERVAREDFYPKNWDGFRDYGTDNANLQVAAAFLISEIARKLIAGEDFFREPRPADQPYRANMPSAEAANA